jgi:hypothetical protein
MSEFFDVLASEKKQTEPLHWSSTTCYVLMLSLVRLVWDGWQIQIEAIAIVLLFFGRHIPHCWSEDSCAHLNGHINPPIYIDYWVSNIKDNTILSWLLPCTCYLPRCKCLAQLRPDILCILGAPPIRWTTLHTQPKFQSTNNWIYIL